MLATIVQKSLFSNQCVSWITDFKINLLITLFSVTVYSLSVSVSVRLSVCLLGLCVILFFCTCANKDIYYRQYQAYRWSSKFMVLCFLTHGCQWMKQGMRVKGGVKQGGIDVRLISFAVFANLINPPVQAATAGWSNCVIRGSREEPRARARCMTP